MSESKKTTKKGKLKPGVASVERAVPGLGDNHIDFFVLPLSERNKVRFKIEDNISAIPDHHKASFESGLDKLSRNKNLIGNGSFVLVSFHKAGEDKQTFKYITNRQYISLLSNINWTGPKEEL